VSDDAVGRYVIGQLKHYSVATDYIRSVKGEERTSLAVVETRAENCQSVLYRNNAADFELSSKDVNSIDYQNAAALIVTGTSFAVEPSRSASFEALTLACAAGCPVIIDIDYRPYSWTSRAEAAKLSVKRQRKRIFLSAMMKNSPCLRGKLTVSLTRVHAQKKADQSLSINAVRRVLLPSLRAKPSSWGFIRSRLLSQQGQVTPLWAAL